MAVNCGFHRPPFFVPDVRATTGTDETGFPNAFVEFHGILRWIEPLPFIQDRDVVPGQPLLRSSLAGGTQFFETAQKFAIQLQAKIGSHPRLSGGVSGRFSPFRISRWVPIQRSL